MLKLAIISVHGSPLAKPGGRETGGMNVYIRESSRELSDLGVAVDVFTRWQDRHLPQVVEFAEHARVIHLKAGEVAPVDKVDVYSHLPEFVHNLRRFKEEHGLQYGLLHSHYWLSGWVGCRLQCRWQVPHVVMFHTLGQVKNRARLGENEPAIRIEAEARIIRAADRVIAATPHERGLMQRFYGAPAHKVEIIPCGVDLVRFRPMDQGAARAALGLGEERIILFVGRIEPLKGVDILLRAFAMLEEHNSVRLAIVGGDGGKDKEVGKLRALARDLGVGQRVTFLGSVDHTLLPQVYTAADICVVPSYYESFGMVAVEAMACGRPVIASRVGGLQSTVRDGETGFLIPWHCPEPFAERLELLLGNERLREQFGKAARQAAERFSWGAISQSLVAAYEDLLGENAEDQAVGGCCCRSSNDGDKHAHVHSGGRTATACCTA